MFTVSCFIRKNTPEIKQYLDKIGYEYGGKASRFDQPYLYCCSLDKYFECNSFPARNHGIVDCGENENLFKAIAALRNDKPDYQWFIWDDKEDMGDPWKQYIPGEHWEDWWWFEVRKASVEELIEHFRDEKSYV